MVKIHHDIEFEKLKKRLVHVGGIDERITLLEQLVVLNPRNPKNLTLRRKYKENLDTLKVKRKTSRRGVGSLYDAISFRRQVLLVGETNTGRSTLLAKLTGTLISSEETPFTTYRPEVQMMYYRDVPIQVVEVPPIYTGDSDTAKYRFIRNCDVLCVCARTNDDFCSTVRQLEDHFIILRNSPLQYGTKHKQKPIQELIEKPAFVASWQTGIGGGDLAVIDINDVKSLSAQIYTLLSIKRIFCMRNGEIEGKPLVFPADQEVTVSDFAANLDKRKLEGLSRARVVKNDKTMPRGQIVGLNHKLDDGDKVELLGLH